MGEVKELRKITDIPEEEIKKMSLNSRMKAYENVGRSYLNTKEPIMIRLDGRSFHSYTIGFDRPFDEHLINAFKYTAVKLAEDISNVRLIYAQSDEITIFLNGFEHESQGMWFEGNKSKIETIAASDATAFFNEYMFENYWGKVRPYQYKRVAVFDARSWNVPRNQVTNCFIWRQLDCIKNSVSMMASSLYPHEQLLKVNTEDKKKLIIAKGQNWEEIPVYKKRGFAVYKVEEDVPIKEVENEKLKKDNLIERDGELFVKRRKWYVDNNIPEFVKNQEFFWNKLGITL